MAKSIKGLLEDFADAFGEVADGVDKLLAAVTRLIPVVGKVKDAVVAVYKWCRDHWGFARSLCVDLNARDRAWKELFNELRAFKVDGDRSVRDVIHDTLVNLDDAKAELIVLERMIQNKGTTEKATVKGAAVDAHKHAMAAVENASKLVTGLTRLKAQGHEVLSAAVASVEESRTEAASRRHHRKQNDWICGFTTFGIGIIINHIVHDGRINDLDDHIAAVEPLCEKAAKYIQNVESLEGAARDWLTVLCAVQTQVKVLGTCIEHGFENRGDVTKTIQCVDAARTGAAAAAMRAAADA